MFLNILSKTLEVVKVLTRQPLYRAELSRHTYRTNSIRSMNKNFHYEGSDVFALFS